MIYTVVGKRILIHDREEWQDATQPVTGPHSYPDLVHHFVVHWPGNKDTWKPPTNTAQYLRDGQASYLASRGYSYGYGFAIGVNPINWNADPIMFDTWEVRGFDIKMASNDGDINGYEDYHDPNFNGRSVSAQFVCSTDYPATDDQIEQARYLVAIADSYYGETLRVIPHCESDATGCPGVYLCDEMDLIATRPTEDDMPLTDTDIEKVAKRAADLVWSRLFTASGQAEPKSAGWILSQGYTLDVRAVRASEEAAANTRETPE